MFKKIITSIILACFIFVNAGVYFVNTANAQERVEEGVWFFQSYQDWYARVYDPENVDEIFGERYTAAQVEWIIYGLFAFLINHFGDNGAIGCILQEAAQEDRNFLRCADEIALALADFASGGFLIPNNISSNTLNESQQLASTNPIQDILSGARPISGFGYLKSAVSKFGPVSEVKAQGFGFEAAGSVRELWKAVRNVTYFFLVLMIIGMAFLIMFRFKINPQTIITIQSALPRIIIALILITFSYAIAGFMIDLMYVVIGILAAVLQSSGLFQLNSWMDMYNRLTGAGLGLGIVGTLLVYMLLFIVTAFLAVFSGLINVTLLLPVSILLFIIIVVVSILALIFIIFKILWMLIKALVTTLLLIAVGPVFIITGGFAGWLKNLASNLAVFAAVGPMLAISFLFLASAVPSGEFYAIFSNYVPFAPRANVMDTNPWQAPYLGMSDMDIVWLFASFVVMTLIPNVANMIKSAIQGKPFGYGTAIGAVVGGAVGTAYSPFAPTIASARDAFIKERGERTINAIRGAIGGLRLPRRSA